MGTGCPFCGNDKNVIMQEKGITFQHFNLKNNQKNRNKRNQYIPTNNNSNSNNDYNNNKIFYTQNEFTGNYKKDFPKGTKYEKELNSNFKFFDVVWYDPNKINDLDNYRKCFSFVRLASIYDLETAKTIFMNEFIFKCIVITPGSKGEELIENLKDFECIRAFFIFCRNEKFEESWPQKFKKIVCVTSNPEILCQKLIEFNKNFAFPNLDYQIKENLISSQNKKQYQKLFEKYSFHIKLSINNFYKGISKYSNFCLKAFEYLDSDEFQNNFDEPLDEINFPLNAFANEFKILMKINKPFFEFNLNTIKNLTLISSEAHEYPFLLNLLSFQEVKNIFDNKITKEFFTEYIEPNISILSHELSYKKFSESNIINEKSKLRELQILLLNFFHFFSFMNINLSLFNNYYHIINYFRDFDFCLKLYLIFNFYRFKTKNHNFYDELHLIMCSREGRFVEFNFQLTKFLIKKPDNIFDEETQNIINDTLTIKDFIILGDKRFHEKIKTIEKNIKSNSFKYLNFGQIYTYLEQIKKVKGKQIIPYLYFLIIRIEDFKENFENILILSHSTGISFLVFLYIENENELKIHKQLFNFSIPVYSTEDILNYLSKKSFYINLHNNFPDLKDFLNIQIPKITFEQSDEDNFKDGCFELAETFDVNLIKNNLLLKLGDSIDFLGEFSKNIYHIYKKHNALDIFFRQNCIYFEWNSYIKTLSSCYICFVKKFLYLYCREESQSDKSFYRIINDDLRSREPSKIFPYINILALINLFIKGGLLPIFEGKVYRATKLDEKLIMKLTPGTKMVNTTFWSTSKKFEVAEKFMKKHNFRNSFIFCKTSKNNIDIDFEKLNPFNEKEVLFLPFTEFKIEKVSSKIQYGRKIFIIELIELGNENFVAPNNMIVETFNSLPSDKLIKHFIKVNGINFDNFK